MDDSSIQDIEIDLLVEGLYRRYGYDFRQYSQASLKRRLINFAENNRLTHLSEIIPRMMRDLAFQESLINGISVPVTEMFRDPNLFKVLRQQIIPILQSYPFINIWHAGCATGEEVYSLAILLKEEGIYDRCQIFATDLSHESLRKAQDGIFSLDYMRDYTGNYQKSGGRGTFSDYYVARYNLAKMDDELKKNITFSRHNLATDGVFIQANLILCRNVLIYFNRTLQDRVLTLLHDSLERDGFLCLGQKESLHLSPVARAFRPVQEKEMVFRKLRKEQLEK
ncbi:MAG: protein-glutamate O-methyltransferase CheR [Magnetococcales bacterium]|nr:protein-glutamate O-methyltransferase CheR [Magnetococcales bacterium]